MVSITKEQMKFILENEKDAYITVINKYAPARKKNRMVALTGKVQKLLREYEKSEKAKVIETYGE